MSTRSPRPIPVSQGTNNVRVPSTLTATYALPTEWRGHSFTKQIRLRFRAP